MHYLHTVTIVGSNPTTSTNRLFWCGHSVTVSTSCCDLDSPGSNPGGHPKIVYAWLVQWKNVCPISGML